MGSQSYIIGIDSIRLLEGGRGVIAGNNESPGYQVMGSQSYIIGIDSIR